MARFFYEIAMNTREMWIREYAHVRTMAALYGLSAEYAARLRDARVRALRNAREARIWAKECAQ